MLNIKFKINGQEVAPGSIKSAVEAAIVKSIIAKIQDKAGRVRCDVHGETPQITVIGGSLKQVSLQIEGCCDEVKNKVQKTFES
jgi:hypothetical protein